METLFQERLRLCAGKTEALLDSLLPEEDGPARRLRDAMRYSLLNGGKRLRAFLTVTFCEACGGRPEHAGPYAAGLEMMHAFSLIHDDLPSMDNDPMRRGKPSNHIAFGESTALLAGDALALLSLETVAGNPYRTDGDNLNAVRILAGAAGLRGMCGGQQLDLQSSDPAFQPDSVGDRTELLHKLVSGKTGALFSAACLLGCIAAGADERKKEAARSFAEQAGLAFQIADDLLDLHASPEALGKTPGKDRESGKLTFPSLIGESEANAYALSLCGGAKQALDAFPSLEAKSALLQFCDYLTRRTN
ncbi:MAG: polyprenyl synthetase family protein [Clostridia bacterium]|nr:polyprenyl synthetase family protein [Clostridia bacterium]